MKKIVVTLIAVFCLFQLTGCGSGKTSDVTIDYGNSEIYSQEDMDAAI